MSNLLYWPRLRLLLLMAAVGDLAALSWWSSLLLLLLVAFWSNWSDGWSGWQSWMRLVGQVSPFLSQPGAMVFRTFRHLVTGFWENLNGGDVGLLESDPLWQQLVSDLNQISQLKFHCLLKIRKFFQGWFQYPHSSPLSQHPNKDVKGGGALWKVVLLTLDCVSCNDLCELG